MSRGFRALKVWMTLRHLGRDGLRRLLRQGIACARHLDGLVRSSEDFEPVQEPVLFIYSLRYAPAALRAEAARGPRQRERVERLLDRVNQEICDQLQASGLAFVMTSRVHGRVVIRLSICSHRTTLADIEQVFEAFRSMGETLLAQSEAA
jgi:glutamate/tyrosine decarboxylase-like PLP-dependent enzyme